MLLGKLERPGTKRKEPARQMSPLRVKFPCSKCCEWPPQLCPTLPCPGVIPKWGMWLCRNLETAVVLVLEEFPKAVLEDDKNVVVSPQIPKVTLSPSIPVSDPGNLLGLAWENEIGICVQSGFTLSRVGSHHPGDSSGRDSSFALWT